MAKHRRPPTVGRHRYGTPGLVHCRTHEAVMLRIRETRLPFWSMLRWRGRHTAVALTRSGARPRMYCSQSRSWQDLAISMEVARSLRRQLPRT